MLCPIIGMIHNMKDQRWHPVYFLVNPRPSQELDDPAMRYKSKAHHTGGFATREEAMNVGIPQLVKVVAKAYDEPRLCLEKDFPWDGEGVPAIVVHFMEDKDGNIVPAF